jgi:hypothetical protein
MFVSQAKEILISSPFQERKKERKARREASKGEKLPLVLERRTGRKGSN